jgi:aryl-alcohol dehydrogenase-like predicted oxidoreductase
VTTSLDLRPLGASGLVVSRVGLGCNNFGRRIGLDQARAVVDAAIDEGITLFDTADSYGDSEEILGTALDGRRDQVVVATKFGWDVGGANGPDWGARGSRRYIRRAVERSLRRLRTDWIDLYQLHRPDGVTPMEETLAALTELVREGKVRYVGSSNLGAWQVADAEWLARTRGSERFVSAQNHYSLLDRGVEADLVPACERYGIGLLPYFPLANGLLTGKYGRGEPPPEGTRLAGPRGAGELTDERFDVVERLEAFAGERSLSLLDVAIGGLAAQPAVASVIAGATSPEQVKANVAAGAWRPSADDLAALDAVAPTPRSR